MFRGRRVLVTAATLAAAIASLPAAQARSQTPAFRAGVAIVELDVRVLDRNRQPVAGLAARDFTITEDGQTRPIVSFRAVEAAPPPSARGGEPAPASGPATATSAVAKRAVVIFIDDGSMLKLFLPNGQRPSGENDAWSLQKAKQLALAAIAQLAPGDAASIVFSQARQRSIDFTKDHALLSQAIVAIKDLGAATTSGDPAGDQRGQCVCGLCSVEVLEAVVRVLGARPEPLRMVVNISPGVQLPQTVAFSACNQQRQQALESMLRAAEPARAVVYTIDPNGLLTPAGGEMMEGQARGTLNRRQSDREAYLRSVAERTGGIAVVNTNAPERAVPEIFAESRAVYFVGVEPRFPADGKFHPLTVKVNRPGLEIRARPGYFAPLVLPTPAGK